MQSVNDSKKTVENKIMVKRLTNMFKVYEGLPTNSTPFSLVP